MVLASSLHLLNVFCNMLPCSVTQPPPQAYISDNADYQYQQYQPVSTRQIDYITPEYMQLNRNLSRLNFTIEGSGNPRPKRLLPDSGPGSRSRPPGSRFTRQNENNGNRLSINSDQSSPNSQRRSMIPSIFSAVPMIPVLINNFNSIMRSSVTTSFGQDRSRVQREGKKVMEPPYVETKSGGVEGYYMGTMKGRRISAYEGIPFAEPPLGKNRFKPPVPKKPWKKTFQAKKTGSNCIQLHPTEFFRVTGEESCLFLNIYSPKIPSNYLQKNASYPTIFLIHGGSFQFGSGAEYGPAYLLDKDVILVTVNYRLGPLGFMSTGDSESPGNNGLKDQALALKWVYENIARFGGDPGRITIMGQSAGAISAHLHLISNKTTQYFHNGVSLSGSSFGFWPILSRKRALELTNQLAKVLQCPRSSSKAMVKCLRQTSANALTAAQMQLYEWIPLHPLILFAPVIEDAADPSAFLTKRPEQAYAANEVEKKPWIFGETSQEGHYDLYFMKLLMQAATIALNGRRYLPIILDYQRNNSGKRVKEITNQILKFYGGAMLGNGVNMNYISDMYTDRYYTTSIRQAIRAHSSLLPDSTYAYLFDFKGKYNLGSLFGIPESDWGVSHTEDMFYFFNSSVFHHGLQRKDVEYGLSQIMTDFLANFVTNGVPTHTAEDNTRVQFWDPVKSANSLEPFQYLRIRKDLEMIDDPFRQRVQFWEDLDPDPKP